MGKTALVAGATGLVGGHVLQTLLADAEYDRVVAVGRRPLRFEHAKLTAVVVDFDRLAESAAALEADHVYCCLGTTIKAAGSQAAFRKVDHDYVVALAKAGRAGGAERFMLVSAVNADAGSRVFYSRVKGEAERDVSALGYAAVHIFRPSFLLGERQENRPGEKIGIGLFHLVEPALGGPLRKYRSVQAADVARAMVAAAKTGPAGVHRYVFDDIVRLARK